jgi:hypothetical protein
MKKLVSFLIMCAFSHFGFSQQLTHPMSFIVNSPQSIAGSYNYGYPIDFGPTTMATVTGDLEWAYTAAGDSLCCDPIVTDLTGKIALIRRGTCNFTQKIYNAQLRGAIACILLSNQGGNTTFNMASGTVGGLVTIPSLSLSQDDGLILTSQMSQGNPVNVSFYVPPIISSGCVLSWAKKTPVDQIIPLQNMRARLINNTSVTKTNVTASLKITDPLGVETNFSFQITSMATAEDSIVTFPGSYTPTAIGTYSGVFKSSIAPNDSVIKQFEITQNTFSLDNDVDAKGVGTTYTNFVNNNYDSHIGAIYRTGSNGFSGDSIFASFALANAKNFIGKTFSYILYEAPIAGFDTSNNDYTSYTQVGLASHIITASDTLVAHSLLTEKLISFSTSLTLNSLAANKEYMLVIKCYDMNGSTVVPRYTHTSNEEFIGLTATTWNGSLNMLGWPGSPTPVLRLNLFQCSPTTATAAHVACNQFTWIDGITYTASNNTAIHTLTNASGCDSIITLNLTINPSPNITTILNGTSISSNETNTGVDFKWLDCNNSNLPILGKVSQTFNALTNGSYAVAITLNGCTDTSACVAITTVGIKENLNALAVVRAYPNPITSLLTIELSGTTETYDVELLNTLGQVVLSETSRGKNITLATENLNAGVYFVKVKNHQPIKIIKN